VFSGAQADLVQVTFNRRVGRIWSMSTFGGYAHNNGLRNGSSSTTRRTYDSQYGGVRFNRPLGRNRNLYLGYSLSHQNYSTPDCTGGGCSGGQLHHSFQIGLSWVPRSIRLD
jgi:outer membrane protein assembly factor BamA